MTALRLYDYLDAVIPGAVQFEVSTELLLRLETG